MLSDVDSTLPLLILPGTCWPPGRVRCDPSASVDPRTPKSHSTHLAVALAAATVQVLATKVRAKVQEARAAGRPLSAAADGFNGSTARLLNRFLAADKTAAPAPGATAPNFPPGLRQ